MGHLKYILPKMQWLLMSNNTLKTGFFLDFRKNRILDPDFFGLNHSVTKTELTKKV